MTFVASDAISELVWSPHKGLSLKYADYSFAEKKSSLLWDVQPSTMVLFPSQSITSKGSNDKKPIDMGSLITSQAAFHVENEDGETVSVSQSPKSSVGIMPVFGSSHGYHSGPESQKIPLRTHEPGVDMAQNKMSSREYNDVIIPDPSARIGDVARGSRTLGLEVALASEVDAVKQCAALHSQAPNLTFPGERQRELSLGAEEGSKDKMKIDGSTSAATLEKVESTSENNLQLPVDEDAYGQIEERISRDKSVPLEASPSNRKTRLCRRKGKEKALSDGYVNERMSKDEDDSHESVESCNSARLFSSGKKRWGFEQQLIVGSKRVKKQIQESPGSTSFVRQDSSFMNWISNMVKGLNKSNQDEAPVLALSLAHSNHGHTSHDHNIITYDRNHDPGSSNIGFQTVFQSLYCSNPKEQETRTSDGDNPTGGSEELVLADKTCGVNITPIACHGENDNFGNQFFQSSEKFKQSTYGNESDPSVKPKTLSTNVANAPGNCKTNSSENKTSHNFACSKVKDRKSSSCFSLGKCEADSAENDSNPPTEGKVINNVGYRSDPVGSLWITRFSPKTPGPVLNLYHCHQNSSGALEHSTHNSVDFPIKEINTETKEYSTEYPVNVASKEQQSYAPNTEASFGFTRIKEHNDQKSMYKLNPVLSSPKYKSSEAMASVFARRLDALKHIKPSDVKDNATHAMATCFYCGRSDHDLRDCSQIIETEREDLIRNVSSFDGAEEFTCLCIRCFQHDHWAISCPVASSKRQHHSEHGGSVGNRFSASKMQLTVGNERYPRMLETKGGHSQVAGVHTFCDGKNSQVDIDLCLNSKYSNEVPKLSASSYADNVMKEKKISSLFNLVDKKFSDVPKGLFDAIKKLRLSRMDVLRCVNSNTSLLHLDGFFLRLRLGKWKEGLGRTGYYVASIIGEQREKSPQDRKNSISVSIGGIRCLIDSPYISNQDFLEDELMAWWCATLRSGGKIPSEDHLKMKLAERKRLGF